MIRGGSRGRVQGVRTPPPPEMTCSFLIQLVFCKKTMWFIGVEEEKETSAPLPKENPGSALDDGDIGFFSQKVLSRCSVRLT